RYRLSHDLRTTRNLLPISPV
ncbi:hypothetical protein AB1N83_011652, partial [Pleurotus pulmonarius]